ncbi:MAG: hypothetical protein KKD28_11810 [Chloroflexi bacterium]|nr:hypothetical protein [Chloroflexota bacterium]
MSALLSDIKEHVDKLSFTEQLWLMEKLIHRMRESTVEERDYGSQLSAMAYDPEIQRELQNINLEFSLTEADGLEIL